MNLLKLVFGVLAYDAFQKDAPARQQLCDAKSALRTLATRHQFAAKGDAHSGTRPTVEATPFLRFNFPSTHHPLFASQQSHCPQSADR